MKLDPPQPGDLIEVDDGLPYLAIVKGHREDGRLFVQPVKVTRSFRPRPVKAGEVNAVFRREGESMVLATRGIA